MRWPLVLVLAAVAVPSVGAVLPDRAPRVPALPGLSEWRDPSWRPYARTSPFNRALPAQPRLHPRSQAMVSRLLGFGRAQAIQLGTAGTRFDYSHPVYFGRASDPRHRIRCTERWGRCAVEGHVVHIPRGARAAAGTDAHLTVIDTRSGWEYDLWGVHRVSPTGGTLRARWGGRTRIDGDGRNSPATAAHFGGAAGVIRASELAAGRIDHALFLVAECGSGRAVYPARGSGARCANRRNAPPLGARFALDMSDAEIAAVPGSPLKRTILRALARYGAYLGDTGTGSWSVQLESGAAYVALGGADPFAALGRANGLQRADDGMYLLDLAAGVDWRRLRVVHPCEARGRC
jgi:hypothetical protein